MAKPVKFSDRDKAWARKGTPRRSYQTRLERKRILIVCEGEKTEPNYFNSIKALLPPHVAQVIDIQGLGANTQSPVNEAAAMRDQLANTDYRYDEVWVVFDRDSFDPDAFNNAIRNAEARGIKVAWSNEAFEIWYILHFENRQTGMNRHQYRGVLTRHLGEPYRKNDLAMYAKLRERGNETMAMRWAKQRQTDCADVAPDRANPCTTVNELVDRLNGFNLKLMI
jgi:hypothetical protein